MKIKTKKGDVDIFLNQGIPLKVKNRRFRYKLQFVWWGRWPKFSVWTWPLSPDHWYQDRPLFWGFYFGLFEIRWFDTKWGAERNSQ